MKTTIPQAEQSLGSNISTASYKILTSRILHLVERKEVAGKLNVSEAVVSQWANGSKPIPPSRMFEIIKAGKVYCQNVQELECEIDLMLLLQFGKVKS